MRTANAQRQGAAMHFYIWNPGDFARATRGLNMQQQGVYRVMLDEYYGNEAPFKGTPEQIADAIGASNDSERQDVAYILRRFFEQDGEQYRQPYADRILEKFLQKAPAREQSKANARARRERYNKQRSILFGALRTVGITPAYNTNVATLRDLAKRMNLGDVLAQIGFMDGTNVDGVPDASGLTGKGVGDGGTQNPLPNTYNPTHTDASPTASEPLRGAVCVSGEEKAKTAAAAADTARRFGIDHSNPRDAKLIALIDQGATLAEFEIACAMTQSRGKGWAYMLGIVEQRQADLAREKPQQGPKSGDRAANEAWAMALLHRTVKTPENGGTE